MTLNEVLQSKSMSQYRLSKESGVPYSTINDLCNGRVGIERCSAETLYRLSKVLGFSMEALVEEAMEHRSSFETFKSTVCHMVKNMGDIGFIVKVLETDRIRTLFRKNWHPESLYLLAMVDYLSRLNHLPLCTNYDDIRRMCLPSPVYPASIIARSAAANSEEPKQDSINNAIPEFRRFNIIESEVRNVT